MPGMVRSAADHAGSPNAWHLPGSILRVRLMNHNCQDI
jgi:hypothetical protein